MPQRAWGHSGAGLRPNVQANERARAHQVLDRGAAMIVNLRHMPSSRQPHPSRAPRNEGTRGRLWLLCCSHTCAFPPSPPSNPLDLRGQTQRAWVQATLPTN